MSVVRRDFKVASSDGIHTLSGVVFCPEGEIKGFFHVVHGMTEYIGRYERFMSELSELGYVSFGYDNLGHGKTAKDDSELGFIAKKRGWDHLAKDVKAFSDAVFAEYSRDEEKQPYFLMGHSMGSFISRLAAERYVKCDKLIIMGTGGSNPLSSAGLAVIAVVKFFYGGKHISKLVGKLAFGNYNDRFEDDGAPHPWLSTNTELRKKYSSDKYCSFQFTVSAMGDLIRVLKYSNRPAWFKNVAKKMPILLISGEDDPVGNFGKGVTEVYEKLKKQGADVECILYKGARHEILNDFTYEQVKADIVQFLDI